MIHERGVFMGKDILIRLKQLLDMVRKYTGKSDSELEYIIGSDVFDIIITEESQKLEFFSDGSLKIMGVFTHVVHSDESYPLRMLIRQRHLYDSAGNIIAAGELANQGFDFVDIQNARKRTKTHEDARKRTKTHEKEPWSSESH